MTEPSDPKPPTTLQELALKELQRQEELNRIEKEDSNKVEFQVDDTGVEGSFQRSTPRWSVTAWAKKFWGKHGWGAGVRGSVSLDDDE